MLNEGRRSPAHVPHRNRAAGRGGPRELAGRQALRDRAKHLPQHVRGERFGEVTVESCLACFPAIFVLSPSRDRGDMHVIELRTPSQSPRDGIAVHHRQADIQEDHVRCELRRDRNRGAAVMRDPGHVAQIRHRHVEHLGGIQIVLDDQDAKFPFHSRWPFPFRDSCARAAPR